MNKIYYILRVMLLNTLIHLSFEREIQTMSDLLMPSMFITALTTFIDVYYGEDLEQTFCNLFSWKRARTMISSLAGCYRAILNHVWKIYFEVLIRYMKALFAMETLGQQALARAQAFRQGRRVR
jgi:hypothetical protein